MTQAPTVEQLMQRIAREYEALSRQLKLIARYLEQNKSRVMLDKTGDIAAACGVAPSAIVRFAQRFGFSGFSEMQEVFRTAYTRDNLMPPSYQHRIRRLIAAREGSAAAGELAREFVRASRAGLDALAKDFDDTRFDAAVDLLQKAENLYIVGVRRAYPVASYLAYALQNTPQRVHLVSGLGGMFRQQIRSVRDDDVVIALSFAPYAKETLYCARVGQLQRARLLVITDSALAPLARRADVLLTVQEGSAFGFRSLASTFCLCQALFIALACRLELDIHDTHDPGGYDE